MLPMSRPRTVAAAGFAPAASSVWARRSGLLSYAALVEPPGFAPGFRVYQTRVLLLDDGSLAPTGGLEPPRYRLTGGRSTAELRRIRWWGESDLHAHSQWRRFYRPWGSLLPSRPIMVPVEGNDPPTF